MEMGNDERSQECHCRAGRLTIVIGPKKKNDTLDAAKEFAAGTGFPAVWFPCSNFDTYPPTLQPPNIPDGVGGWRPVAGKLDAAITKFSKDNNRYCGFEEVLVMAHGHQLGIYKLLAELLPKVFDRQVTKLDLWICGNCRDRYAFANNQAHDLFAKICAAAGPRPCECGCDQSHCRAYNVEGKLTKCPLPEAPTTVLSAGYYKNSAYGVNEPSPLSIDPSNTQQFGAPEARLIETTVTEGADGNSVDLVSHVTTTADVSGATVRDDRNISGTAKISFDPGKYLGNVHKKKEPKPKRAPYNGPKADDHCPNHDGCLVGAK